MTVKTTLFAVVTLSVAAVATSAQAGEWGGWGNRWAGREGGWDRWSYVDDFCKQNGVRFSDGYFYPGQVQKHFTEKWYDWRFKTYLHFDPHARMPYYWCEGHGVWYPVNYIGTVGPGAKGPGPVVAKPGVGGPAVGGVPASGAPVGGAAPAGGAPAGGQPVNGGSGAPAPVGGNNIPPPEPTSAPAGASPIGTAAPAKPIAAATGVTPISVARVEKLPPGTFDEAVPEDVK